MVTTTIIVALVVLATPLMTVSEDARGAVQVWAVGASLAPCFSP